MYRCPLEFDGMARNRLERLGEQNAPTPRGAQPARIHAAETQGRAPAEERRLVGCEIPKTICLIQSRWECLPFHQLFERFRHCASQDEAVEWVRLRHHPTLSDGGQEVSEMLGQSPPAVVDRSRNQNGQRGARLPICKQFSCTYLHFKRVARFKEAVSQTLPTHSRTPTKWHSMVVSRSCIFFYPALLDVIIKQSISISVTVRACRAMASSR